MYILELSSKISYTLNANTVQTELTSSKLEKILKIIYIYLLEH